MLKGFDNQPGLIYKGSNPTSDEEAAGERSEGNTRKVRSGFAGSGHRPCAKPSEFAAPAIGAADSASSEPLTRRTGTGGLACWSAAPLGKRRARPVY
jgi:hypothetical protein